MSSSSIYTFHPSAAEKPRLLSMLNRKRMLNIEELMGFHLC